MADVELLPLPRWMETYRIPGDDLHTGPDQYLSDRMQAYTRANLAPLQAENERLRAEVAAWRELSDRMEAVLDQLQAEIERMRAEVEGWKEQHARDSAELRRICQHRDEYKASADKLTEALREWWSAHRPVGWTEDQHRARPYVNLITVADKALTEALLRDQEARND